MDFLRTPLTEKAFQIALKAHSGQLDKAGQPYIMHPCHVASQMADEYKVAAALLHDVVEDTPVTIEQLIGQGIPEQVIEALRLLTHDSQVPYLDYVRRLKENEIARAVKLADLEHNSDLSRLEAPTQKDLDRAKKYEQAKLLLLS